jgi:3-phosphoshikimate 1-carboxyvinyltransferase
MRAVSITPSRLSGKAKAPPSKSYTHRLLILATLASTPSVIEAPLRCDDTLASLRACSLLGAKVELHRGAWLITPPRRLRAPPDVIEAGGSGTTARFITALCSLADGGYSVVTGDESLRRRPMAPLLSALRNLGVECFSTRGDGHLPVVIRGGGLRGGRAELQGDVSSQFLSALLVAALKAEEETALSLRGALVSRPYVESTLACISLFGGRVRAGQASFYVPPAQSLRGIRARPPGDVGLALLLASSILLSGGAATIEGLDPALPQADFKGLRILRELGCELEFDRAHGRLSIRAEGELEGGTYDLADAPDLLPVLAPLAVACRKPLALRNVRHARFKESDRIAALSAELRKVGLQVEEEDDGLIIGRGDLRPAALDPHNDHRLFMAFCALSQAVPGGCMVLNPGCVSKSFPAFLRTLRALGAKIEVM